MNSFSIQLKTVRFASLLVAASLFAFISAPLAHAQYDGGDFGSYGDYGGGDFGSYDGSYGGGCGDCTAPSYSYAPDTSYSYTPDTTYSYTPDTAYSYTPDTTYSYTPDASYSYTPDSYDYSTPSYDYYTPSYSSYDYSTPAYSSYPSYSYAPYASYSYPTYHTYSYPSYAPSNNTLITNTNTNTNVNTNTNINNVNTVSNPSYPVAAPTYYPVYMPTPTYTPPVAVATNPYVTLSAVPYTGLDLGPWGTALYWGFLILWCLFAAYLLAVKRVQNTVASRLKVFLFGGASAGASHEAAKTEHAHAAPVMHASHAHEEHAPARESGYDEFIMSQIYRGLHA